MNNISTLIWDWNGTLLNDVDVCVETINQLLAERKLPELTRKKYLEIFDFPVQNYYQSIGFDFEKEPFEIPANEYIEKYYANIDKTSLYPSVTETLTHFSKLNFRQLILSAAEQTQLITLLKNFKIDRFFEEVSGLDNIYATSKIELGINMFRKLNLVPETVCLIGDTTHDLEVASALGCRCILIANGHQEYNRLIKTQAIVINNINELKKIIIN